MSTYTYNESESFSIIDARKIASKVATDLKRMQRFYNGVPSDVTIDRYEKELAVLLYYDVVASVAYGFKRNGAWTEATVRYTALPGGSLQADDDPGKIRPNLDVAGASFYSFLSLNGNWSKLTATQQAAVESESGVSRGNGDTPPLEAGYWNTDLTYSAAGRGLGRATVRR
jgi:hypothetical protein